MNSKLLYNVFLFLLGFPFMTYAQDCAFRHLDVSLTGGTTGIGIDLSTNITDWMRLRAGFDAMPRFEKDVRFGISSMDETGKLTSNFNVMSEKLKSFAGYDVNDYIDMTCKPTFYNFKFLMDFHPFKRVQSFMKNMYFTAGFYWGSSEIARAVNDLQGAQTLNGMLMYNHLYDVAVSGDPLVSVQVVDEYDGQVYDQYIYLDPYLTNSIKSVGRLGVNVGVYAEDVKDEDGNVVYKKGTPYLMEPDRDGTARAQVKANSFKPYLGIGYGGRLIKNNDSFHISADLGVLFWGGKPNIITHDGTDLSRDVENIKGKVGDYVDLVGALRVYPVLNLRFTYTLF